MRQIKFRGKRTDTGEWAYGSLLTDGLNARIGHFEVGRIGLIHDVDPETVGQFTEIKDSKGTEIYDGDIIRSNHFFDVAGTEQHLHHVVKWSENMTGWVTTSVSQPSAEGGKGPGNPQLWVFARNFEDNEAYVVGNIHETTPQP